MEYKAKDTGNISSERNDGSTVWVIYRNDKYQGLGIGLSAQEAIEEALS